MYVSFNNHFSQRKFDPTRQKTPSYSTASRSSHIRYQPQVTTMHFLYFLTTLFALLLSSTQAAPFNLQNSASLQARQYVGATATAPLYPRSTASLYPRHYSNSTTTKERRFEGARSSHFLSSRTEDAPFPKRNETIVARAAVTSGA
jgi:hypothetical protein